MESDRFDALARAAATRRGLFALAGLWGGVALTAEAAGSAKRRRRRRRRRKGGQERQYPVFTTCYTDEGEVGEIPEGPHPTCQSQFDPDEFVPCHPLVTFADLKAACDEAYPACEGNCRIKAEPIVGLGIAPTSTSARGRAATARSFAPCRAGPSPPAGAGPTSSASRVPATRRTTRG